MLAVNPWKFHIHPEVWVVMAGAAVAYWWANSRLADRLGIPAAERATRKQRVTFGIGLFLLYICSEWPVHDISEKYLYSVHMVQHMDFTLIAPPLLLLGVPAWLTRWILQPRSFDWVARRLTKPLIAGAIYSIGQGFVHWPLLVNTSLRHEPVHFLVHLFIFSSAMLMWFPVLNKLPEYPTMSHPVRMMYLFAQSIIPNVPVAFLAFATTPVYSFYAHVPRPFGGNAVTDQQVAAAIMKVGGTAIIWSTILVMFFQWYADEQKGSHPGTTALPEDLTWDDVEQALASSEAPVTPT